MEQLAKNILAKWYTAVDADLEKYPFSEEELSKVSDKYKKRYLSGQRQEKAYGTTLIAVCQTREYWFGIQIGDGKCVCISQDGSMHEPIPWDEDCQENITTSICDSEAIDEFRYCYMNECPAATLIGTDGIDDSYANTEELYVLYRSILAIFAEHGRETGESEIQAFLPGLSRKGSGDDVSIAGIVSASLSTAFIEVLKAQCEYSNARELKEQAEREVVRTAERQEYVLSAMKKAKMNYEACEQKANEVREAIEVAQHTQEDAVKRFNAAQIALTEAVNAYQSITAHGNINVGAAKMTTEEIEDNTATDEQDGSPDLDSSCKESEKYQVIHVKAGEMKAADESSNRIVRLNNEEALSETEQTQTADGTE